MTVIFENKTKGTKTNHTALEYQAEVKETSPEIQKIKLSFYFLMC